MNLKKTLTMTFIVMMIVSSIPILISAQKPTPSAEPFVGPGSRDNGRTIVRNWDIVVAFEFAPTKNKLNDVIEGLKRGNQVLYDATEGQFRFRSAQIWTNGKNFNDGNTDIQILDSGANYRANAIRGGITMNGQVIHLGKTDFGSKWNSTIGALTIAHEWGHYGLWLYDEYKDEVQGQYTVSVPWCVGLMANSSDMDRDSEFCTLDNHNYTNPNETWDKSSWEVINDHYPGVNMPLTAASIQQNGPFYPPEEEMTFGIHFPDLYIEPSDISISPTDPMQGEATTISALVHNKDSLLSGDVIDVKFFDGPPADQDIIGVKSYSISGNPTDTITIDWVAEGGTHDIYVQVDPKDQVAELEEYSNNTAFEPFVIPAKPVISPLLKDQSASEDETIVLDLKPFESDIESSDSELLWTVSSYDDTVIDHIEGEGNADDIINITPKANYFGTTDITLTLTDGDGMTDGRTINLTWSEVNDPPMVGAITLGKEWVYRSTPVLISFDGSDVDNSKSELSPVLEYRPSNTTGWDFLTPVLEGTVFNTLFTPAMDAKLGPYDIRAKLTDSTSFSGEYAYLNSTLMVLNTPATITDFDLPGDKAYRGQALNISIQGSDSEDQGNDLLVNIEYMQKGDDQWLDAGTFDDKSGSYNDGSWEIPFVPALDAVRGVCDVRIRLVDKDGPGIWQYINDTIIIKNSLPMVEEFTADTESVLRTQEVVLTIDGFDYEDDQTKLEPRIEYIVGSDSFWKSLDPSDYTVTFDAGTGTWSVIYVPPDDADYGIYDLRAVLKDTTNEEGPPLDIEIPIDVQNNLPVVTIKGKDFAGVGEVVTFDGKGSSDVEDSSGLKYSWEFGDGARSSKNRIGHSYSQEGVYKVTLTVTDRDGGVSTSEMKISISGGGGPSVSGNLTFVIAGVIILVVIVALVVIVFMRQKGIGPFG